MKLKAITDQSAKALFAIEYQNRWQKISEVDRLWDLLNLKEDEISTLGLEDLAPGDYSERLPFSPSAFRDFMLYEKHAIDAARGFVKKYMPKLYPVVKTYEKLIGKPFPRLKPKKRYYQHPIFYLGNHLNFIPHEASISIPSYTQELDYELEIGAFIHKPLKNASVEEANEALGGFVIINDFSARDVQFDEMATGFGPMKTKNFGSSMSSILVTKDELLPRLDDLKVKVIINEQTVVESNSSGKLFSLSEAIAYASWEEQLHPGELFGSGTIPGCTGIENGVMLKQGDRITLEVEGIGQLSNQIK